MIVGDQFASQAHMQPGSPLKIKGPPYTVSGIFHSGVTFEDSGVGDGVARRPRRSPGIVGGATTIAIALKRNARPGRPPS